MKCGVYRIFNKINGRFYIGSSIDIIKRCKQHAYHLNSNNHLSRYLQHSWNKYGWNNFEFEIIELCNKDDLLAREQFYLDDLKPLYNTLKFAYSTLGSKRTKETKAKMSAWQTGRKMSKETRENMRLAQRKISQWPCEAGKFCKCENCSDRMREYKKLKAREYRAVK